MESVDASLPPSPPQNQGLWDPMSKTRFPKWVSGFKAGARRVYTDNSTVSQGSSGSPPSSVARWGRGRAL